jgi:hypothetical protein
MQRVATGGAPKSVAEHECLVYVLNTGDSSLTGFRLTGRQAEPLPGSTRELVADADPAQVGFSPDGATVVVTERGTNAIVTYPVSSSGYLGDPRVRPSSRPTRTASPSPGAEAFGAQVGKAAASSYLISDSGVTPVSRSVGNGRIEICWAVAHQRRSLRVSPPTSPTGPCRAIRSASMGHAREGGRPRSQLTRCALSPVPGTWEPSRIFPTTSDTAG